MESIERRVIPGYEGYSVTNDGRIFSIERDIELRQYLFNGYYIVDTFRGSLTQTLPVHRAVSLAWVENKQPDDYNIVNHIDGNPLNNLYTNLEWTDCSGNNYHAVNTGLRRDNIPCKVRDFETGIVHDFPSLAQAAVFMGLGVYGNPAMLNKKMFGALIRDRYEFRYQGDSTPWFYQERKQKVGPSRYMVTVVEPDGNVREFFSRGELLKAYKVLYRSQGCSIPSMVAYAIDVLPRHEFVLRDSYTETQFIVKRSTLAPKRTPVSAIKDGLVKAFNSLSACAAFFSVDRSTIQGRLNNGKTFDGWLFETVNTAAPS